MPSYSEIRKQELKHIEEEMKNDRKFKRKIAGIYRNSSDNIQRHIDADIALLATSEGVSKAEAKKIISKTDVEAFQSTAERMVEDRDFTPKANRELRRYNVTMRTNREELLNARINLETIDLALQEERMTGAHISDEAINEYKRQAGILGMSAPSQSKMKQMAKAAALSDVSGATFSDRIWANQDELRKDINNAINRALIRGENPRKAAAEIKRNVRSEYGKKKRAADRIAVTETARAQTIAARESMKDAGIDKYIWIAEPDACPICAELDGQTFMVESFTTTVPAHPHCRCAISSYVD
ncbi:minor capsid protein [Salinicoccus albus]|uniref:minor capsid protein n=1 Tax=Salinicoccus albus TaxID=418756 RepID=UPI0003813B95|nr:minor capsid protein [Salinicoccus albus]